MSDWAWTGNHHKSYQPNINGGSEVKGHENEIQALRYAQESNSYDIQNPGSGGGFCKVTTSSFAFDMKINAGITGLKNVLYKSTHIKRSIHHLQDTRLISF